MWASLVPGDNLGPLTCYLVHRNHVMLHVTIFHLPCLRFVKNCSNGVPLQSTLLHLWRPILHPIEPGHLEHGAKICQHYYCIYSRDLPMIIALILSL